jgi:hypothetical protein
LVPVFEDQSQTAWAIYTNETGTSTKSGKSTVIAAPDGTNNGNKLVISATANSGIYQLIDSTLLQTGGDITVSVWAWTESGTNTIRINYYDGSTSTLGTGKTIHDPHRITQTFTLSGDKRLVERHDQQWFRISPVTVVWWGYQIESAEQRQFLHQDDDCRRNSAG